MDVLFFGSGAFGLPALQRLAEAGRVTAVVTQPDRPAGRSKTLRGTPVARFAREQGLTLLQPADCNTTDALESIQRHDVGAMVVIAYGQKLGAGLLHDDTPAVNLHASLLPRYRGAAPINWAILRGERETGVSVIRITPRIDAGDVLAQRTTVIDPLETAGELHDRLAMLGPEVIEAVLGDLETGRSRPVPQDERLATRAPKLSKGDGRVQFGQPPEMVCRHVHGVTPWPGCRVGLGTSGMHLLRVTCDDRDAVGPPGRLAATGLVTCDGGSVRLLEVQPAGGRQMTWEAFARGRIIPDDVVLEPR